LRRARDDIYSGQWENSLEALKRINPKAIPADLVRHDLEYYVAYCKESWPLTGGGDKAAAEATLRELVRQDPRLSLLSEAAELLGVSPWPWRTTKNALRYYSAIGRAPWRSTKSGQPSGARVLAAQGKYEKRRPVTMAPCFVLDTPEATQQKSILRFGKAICLAETGKHEKESGSSRIRSPKTIRRTKICRTRYNALGRCHLRAKQPKEAILAYLHVDQLFFSVRDIPR